MGEQEHTQKLVDLLLGAMARAEKEQQREKQDLDTRKAEYARLLRQLPDVVERAVKDLRGAITRERKAANSIVAPKQIAHNGTLVPHVYTFELGTPKVLTVRWLVVPNDDATDGTVEFQFARGAAWELEAHDSIGKVDEAVVGQWFTALVLRLFSDQPEQAAEASPAPTSRS